MSGKGYPFIISHINVLNLISKSVIFITGLTGFGYGVGKGSHGTSGLIIGLGSGLPGLGLMGLSPGPGIIYCLCDFNHAIK